MYVYFLLRFEQPTIEWKLKRYRTARRSARSGRTWWKNSPRCFGLIIRFIRGTAQVSHLQNVRVLANVSGILIIRLLHRSKNQLAIFVAFRQIGELRAQYRQLTRLLTSNERSGLGADTLMQCFDVKGISVFYHHLFIAKEKKVCALYIDNFKIIHDQYTMKTTLIVQIKLEN